MKKNNVIKTIIYLLVGNLLLITLILTFVHIHQGKERGKKVQVEAQIKEKAIENASKNGYSVQLVDEKKFYIEKDGVKYVFSINASGVCFDECEFKAQEEGVKVKEGEVILTIRSVDDGNVQVRYDDTRIVLLDDGTEEGMFCGSYFISNTDFDKESLIIDYFLPDAEQKSIDAYEWIMKFITVEGLKEQYNKALSICEQLNEGL